MRSPADQQSPASANGLPPITPNPQKARSNFVFLIIALGFMVLVGIGLFLNQGNTPVSRVDNRQAAKVTATPVPPTSTALPTPTERPEIKVYINGEVKNPGVYTMQPNDRVVDAINAAGGLSENADTNQLDLALRVRDEMRITVPKININTPAPAVPAISVSGTPPASANLAVSSDGKININSASAADLDKLPGIGEVLSARIVEYRTKNGLFKNLDDLRKVPGLTKAVVDKIKDQIAF